MRRATLATALILGAAGLYLWPTLASGRLPSGPDAAFHAQTAQGVADGWADGRLYPRWISEASYGFGSTALISYPPLGPFSGAVFIRLGLEPGRALQLALALFVLISGWLFYHCARRQVGVLSAGIGAAFYLLLPYHVVDADHRFALAELAAFLWLPALLTLTLEPVERGRALRWFLLSLTAAALVLTHPGIAYLAAIVLAPLAGVVAWRERSGSRLGLLAAAALTALLLTAIYWLPLLAEHSFTSAATLTEHPWHQPGRSFLFTDEVALGYPPSVLKPRLERTFWLHALVAATALWILRRRRHPFDLLLVGGFVAASLLQLSWTSPLWESLPGLSYVQFPWRAQVLQVLFASLLVARAFSAGAPAGRRTLGALLAGLAALAILTPRLGTYRFDGENYQGLPVRFAALREYLTARAPAPAELHKARERVLAGREAEIEISEWSSHRRRLEISTDVGRTFVLRTFWFPGWRVRANGEPVEVSADDRWGAIRFHLPRGVHAVEVAHGLTPARRLGGTTSTVSLSALLLAAYALRRRSRNGGA